MSEATAADRPHRDDFLDLRRFRDSAAAPVAAATGSRRSGGANGEGQ